MSAGRAAFEAAFSVSHETMARFDIYEKLIQKWNTTINLISAKTTDEIWTRHFHDSAAVLAARGNRTGRWVDLGSGGGFPGAVVAILAAEKAPEIAVTCIETDLRKATFLRTLGQAIGVPIQVLSRRIEECPRQDAAVLSARALAPLSKLLAYAETHLAPSGIALFQKGETWRGEVEEALETFRFSVENKPSPTNPGSAILVIGDISRA